MEAVTNPNTHEGHNGMGSGHPLRNDVGKFPSSSPPKDNENHALPRMPLGFQGMLKTSTETGDIGQFSIKPPRVPHHPAALPGPKSPRRRSNTTKTYVERPLERYANIHPITDDRRRLPSYNVAPNAAADTVSLFDSASQRSTPSSGRPFRDAEYRASSMTASCYSPFGISSNHNSYISLRSQPEPITQRPRSPYLYPARLKRPGCRPTSPLLSDAGVDYSRRAEIDRILVPPTAAYRHYGRSASPSSYYAHKRVPPPPLSIRTENNRSNPSPRKPQSPNRNQHWQNSTGFEDSFRDWARRKDVIGPPGDVSPARSNYSYASTVNHYRSGPPASSTTAATPGRLHPPSPLYYDYTEEFETDGYSEQMREDPPPPFQLEKTIPEDRPLSTGWENLETSEVRGVQPQIHRGRSIRSSVGELVTDYNGVPKPHLRAIDHIPEPGDDFGRPRIRSVASVHRDSLENLVRMYENENDNNQESHPNDGPRTRRSFPLKSTRIPQEDGPLIVELPAETVVANPSSDPVTAFELAGDNLTDRSSDYSLSSNLPMNFPKPPTPLPPMPLPPIPLLVDKLKGDGSGKELHLNKKLPVKPPDDSFVLDPQQLAARPRTSIDRRDIKASGVSKHKRSASSKSAPCRSSRMFSVDPGLKDLAELVSTFEAAKARGEFGWSISELRPPLPKPILSNILQPGSNTQHPIAPEQRTVKQYRSESNLSGQSYRAADRHGYQVPYKTVRAVLQATPNFTPMFAPKPISPARVAKLKTTVPQLMKALPALPLPKPESIRAISPPASLPHYIGELPFRFSPFLPSPTPSSQGEGPAESDSESVHEMAALPKQPPKVKLRLKRSELTVGPTSGTPRPWNLDESYPWSAGPVFQVGSGTGSQQPTQPKVPKFKLKVSRPSISSIETVRVNRAGGAESRESLGLENPRDLFTPPSRTYGIHALFSKVSRHFSHPKKRGAVGQSASMVNVNSAGQIERHRTNSSDRGSSLDLGIPQLQVPIPIRSNEARSFFSDDSSQVEEGHSLRRRITNFRARLPTPYTSRAGTLASRSCDDIVYRERSLRAVNVLGMHDYRLENENISEGQAENHRTKLKSRLTGWLGRAKNLMTVYMRPRNHGSRGTGSGDAS